METRTVKPAGHPVQGGPARIPGSKSITNRALLLSALSEGETKLSNVLVSDDSLYMIEALSKLGVPVEFDEGLKTVVLRGVHLPSGKAGLYVGNAGTAMRFLASYLALGEGEFVLDGDPRMRERPAGDLIDALSQLGCEVESVSGNGCPPLRIAAHGIKGGVCRIGGSVSSQFLSSLLLSAPYSAEGVEIRTEGGVASKPYVDMTIRMMERFGVKTVREGYGVFRVGPSRYRAPGNYAVEPDASAASYFLAAVAILGGKTTVEGIGTDSLQGDSAFAEVLGRMGCRVARNAGSVTIESDGKLRGVDADMNSIPDTAMTLAVTAMFAKGPTRIRNVANLRVKESDRLAATAEGLSRLGAGVVEYPDGLEIRPAASYRPASIDTFNDHRIAMSFALAGLKLGGVVIENPSCVSKTFPDYFEALENFLE